MPIRVFSLLYPVLALALVFLIGCQPTHGPDGQNEVIVYTALDQDFSEPLLDAFFLETGIRVRAKYDTESTKTIGLTNAIIAEAARPRCDVFWNNEVLNTLRLQRRGLLDAYRPAKADDFPDQHQDTDGHWHGFAARARVFIVNRDRLQPADDPSSIRDLADAKWKDRVGIAKPLFGTTATHAAVLFARDTEKAKSFFRSVRENVKVMAGNKQVALAVARGQLDWGLTDTDDAMIEIEKGMPVEIVYPDQAADEDGTLFIPNTLAIIKNGPNPKSARLLVDYLLTSEVEMKLAASPSAQIPLAISDANDGRIRVETPQTIKAVDTRWQDAADKWDIAAEFLRDEFARGD